MMVYTDARGYTGPAVPLRIAGWYKPDMTVSDVIRSAMLLKKLNQTQLAEMVGVAQPTVQRWLSGMRAPELEIVPKLARVLEVEPHTLMNIDIQAVGLAPTKEVADIVEFYSALNPTQKHLVREMARQLSGNKTGTDDR